MKQRPKSWNGNALLAWFAALAFAAAAAWPRFFGSDIPLVGLRALSDLRLGVPLAGVSVALALFLSLRRWATRDALLVCAGASLCLFAVVTYAVGASVAMPFAFIGGNLLRESRSTRAQPAPHWAETQ